MQRYMILLIGVLFGTLAQTNELDRHKTVTFVCEHGVAKSVIAAAYFNKLAEEQNLPYRAVSRGTSPDNTPHAATTSGLEKDGLRTPNHIPTKISEQDEQRSTYVVTIGIDAEPLFLRTQKLIEWDGVPSVSNNYEAARDDLKQRVASLLLIMQNHE